MYQFTEFLIGNRRLILVFSLLIIVGGYWSWDSLPIDAFPDVTNIQVMVLTKAPGLAPLDVERQITFPIEQRMSGMKGVIQVRSSSKGGLSQIVVVFDDDSDPYFARQLVFERLQEAREELPAGVEPEMAPLSTGLGEVFQYTLDSSTVDATELRTIQDWIVAPQLRTIANISEVNSFGGFVKQYQVLPNPDKLQQYKISLEEIITALERNNTNVSGNFITRGWEQFYVRALGLLQTPEDIGNIVLKTVDGTPVHVHDLAEVKLGHMTRQGAVTRDGKGEAVAGIAIMLRGSNSKTVVDAINRRIPGIRASLPPGVSLNVFYDRTHLIRECVKTVINALNEGGILVVVVLFLFLAEWRMGLLVFLSLPFSFLLCFIAMKYLGVSANLMTLGGLAFSVGTVCDPTIVVLENIRRHFVERGQTVSPRETVPQAVAEVGRPTAFSELIIILVIVPIFALQGFEAKMFTPFATTLLLAMASAMIVSFLLMPVFGYYFVPRGEESEFFISALTRRLYQFVLDLSLRVPVVPIVIGLLLAGIAWQMLGRLGTDFMPSLKEGAIAINVVRLPNANLEGAVQVSTAMEKLLLEKFPEVEAVVSKTGRAEISEDPMGPEQTDIIITLKPPVPGQSWRTQDQLVAEIQKELGQFPGLRYAFSQPISLRVNELISGIKSDVAVKVFGDDIETLSGISKRVADVVGKVSGAVDVRAAQVSGMEQIDIDIDREAAARHGVNVSHIQDLIEAGIGGKIVSHIIEGQKRFSLAVRFPETFRGSEEAIGKLRVLTPVGSLLPIGQFVRFHTVQTPIEVARESGRRRMVVETNVRGRDLGGFVTELRNKLQPLQKELPDGYYIEYGGQFENQERAMERLKIVVPISLVLILVLLIMAMGKLSDAFLVLLNLPFAVVGG
ncbi:MAG TPA: CusA/CzcA family heavy metal efflux RND transporter, partial [Candidatus Ozemobacteraceae bacterium]|nr:CusA/CzcA family heavy metal efflux RND transporter [Candidatus Ozemobacteraceae bacterium]